MIALSSTDAVLTAMQHAHSVGLTAYVMRPGRMLSALEDAARRGAHVTVRLEACPYADTSGDMRRQNENAIRELRSLRADAKPMDCDGAQPLHLKGAHVDDALFLDDRNWPDDGRDTIIRDDDPRDIKTFDEAISGKPQNDAPLATQKDPALQREANLIYRAADMHQAVDVESESFGYSRVYAALKRAAEQHAPVRLMVAQRDVSPRSEHALDALVAEGVAVRLSANDEKMAVTPTAAWLGSSNATFGVKNQIDWGLDIFDRSVISSLHQRFEKNWAAATPYAPPRT